MYQHVVVRFPAAWESEGKLGCQTRDGWRTEASAGGLFSTVLCR